MKKQSLDLVLLLCGSLLAVPAFAAEVYRWVDEKGVTHYSETPPPKGVKHEVRNLKPEDNVVPAFKPKTMPAARPAAPKAPAAAAAKPPAPPTCPGMLEEADARGGKPFVAPDNPEERKQQCDAAKSMMEATLNRDDPSLSRGIRTGCVGELEARIKVLCQ